MSPSISDWLRHESHMHVTVFIKQLTVVGTIYYEQIANLGDQFDIFYTLED